MNKKGLIISLALLGLLISINLVIKCYKDDNMENPIDGSNSTDTNINNGLNLPTTGNDYIINTKSGAKIRVINEYTTEYFTSDKNLLIMFGSWCAHCKEEFEDVKQIVEFYKDNNEVNVILIAHEFEDTVNDLVTLIEDDFKIKNTPVFIDLKRIIRKNLDPEASTVPISYVVNKDGNVLQKYNDAITLDIAKDMLK